VNAWMAPHVPRPSGVEDKDSVGLDGSGCWRVGRRVGSDGWRPLGEREMVGLLLARVGYHGEMGLHNKCNGRVKLCDLVILGVILSFWALVSTCIGASLGRLTMEHGTVSTSYHFFSSELTRHKHLDTRAQDRIT
jgi:hypothetical protein